MVNIANKIQEHIDHPTIKGEELIKKYEVKTEEVLQETKQENKTAMGELSQTEKIVNTAINLNR